MSSFQEEISKLGKFDGTSLVISGCSPLSVARYPDRDHEIKLFSLLRKAQEYNKIEFSIDFCIAFSSYCKCGSKACLPLFGEAVTRRLEFQITKQVRDFFNYLPFDGLYRGIESLETELTKLTSKIEPLKSSHDEAAANLRVLKSEISELKQNLAKIQLFFQEADNRLRALENLLKANSLVVFHFGELAILKPEFSTLMIECEAKKKSHFEKMAALTSVLSEKEKMAEEIAKVVDLHETELRSLLFKKNKAEADLRKAKIQLFSMLAKLNPKEVPSKLRPFLEAGSILSVHMLRMFVAKKNVPAHLRMLSAETILSAHLLRMLAAKKNMPAHLRMLSAGSILSAHLRMISAQKNVHPWIAASETCKICFDEKDRCIILGCGHGLFCMQCIGQLPDKTCPICRDPIQSTRDSFMYEGKFFPQ